MPVATNPRTGEVIYLDQSGQWQPAKVARNPETGERLAFDGQQWQPLSNPPAESWSEVPGKAIRNLPSSAAQFAEDFAQPFLHPIDTASALGNLAVGGAQKVTEALGIRSDAARANDKRQYADAVGQFFSDRYGSERGLMNTLATDPVGAVGDLASVLSGGGAVAARIPGAMGGVAQRMGNVGRFIEPSTRTSETMGKIAQGMVKAGKFIDPSARMMQAAPKAGGMAARGVGEVLGMTTGVGWENIARAMQAGLEGGKKGEAFRSHMRGDAPLTDIIDQAKYALNQMRSERSRQYLAAMQETGEIPDIVDFGKVQSLLRDAKNNVRYKGMKAGSSVEKTISDIQNILDKWAQYDQIDFHTAGGLDALKREVGELRYGSSGELPLRGNQKAVVDHVYAGLKGLIEEVDPEYAKTMKNYEEASTLIDEIERAFSLGNKASADTAMRKLQSLSRNNVQTNYGNRLRLAQELENAGAGELLPSVAGQSLSSIRPRSLTGSMAGLGALGQAYYQGLNPLTIPAVLASSPRLVGETAHAMGRIGEPAAITGRWAMALGRAATEGGRGLTSQQLGRLARILQEQQ